MENSLKLPDWWKSENPYYIGNVLDEMKKIPDSVVQCVVTSPPYWALRDYLTATWEGGNVSCNHTGIRRPGENDKSFTNGGTSRDKPSKLCLLCGAKRIDKQIGLESTPKEYVNNITRIAKELWRVLRNDGTFWLNLGDTYCANRTYQVHNSIGAREHTFSDGSKIPEGLKSKDLVGIPWRVAFALQESGWYLRMDNIWSKNNCMPESVMDRPTKSHEYIFLLSKSDKYYYDNNAVKEKQQSKPHNPSNKETGKIGINTRTGGQLEPERIWASDGLRNLRSVWNIPTKPYKGSHFAVFPPEIPEICIKAGTSEKGTCPKCGSPWERVLKKTVRKDVHWSPGTQNKVIKSTGKHGLSNVIETEQIQQYQTIGWQPTCKCGITETVPCIVLDPFLGSGTTIMVAKQLGRIGLGIELNPEYEKLINERINYNPTQKVKVDKIPEKELKRFKTLDW